MFQIMTKENIYQGGLFFFVLPRIQNIVQKVERKKEEKSWTSTLLTITSFNHDERCVSHDDSSNGWRAGRCASVIICSNDLKDKSAKVSIICLASQVSLLLCLIRRGGGVGKVELLRFSAQASSFPFHSWKLLKPQNKRFWSEYFPFMI